MTIQEMHIGLNVVLQRINSNLFGKLLHEEIDYFINSVTKQLIRAVLLDEKNTVASIVGYSDIRQYYDTLHPYIKSIDIPLTESLGNGYTYGTLPSGFTTDSQTSGTLKKGIKYKVLVAGTATPNFTNLGAASVASGLWVVGYEFVCDIDDLSAASIDIVVGETYRVINPGDATTEFANTGLATCTAGTQWTATATAIATATTTGWTYNPTIEHITDQPTDWGTGTIVIAISTDNYFLDISTTSNTDLGNPITSGTLDYGKQYRIDVVGTTNLSNHGAYVYTGDNVVFTCNSESTITWEGGTSLYATDRYSNNLVKYQDVSNMLDNSFGTVISSPISSMANSEVRVYHENKFEINRVYLNYIREPISVDWNNSINSDLPINLHDKIVDITAQFIMSVTNNPAYEKLMNENINGKKE